MCDYFCAHKLFWKRLKVLSLDTVITHDRFSYIGFTLKKNNLFPSLPPSIYPRFKPDFKKKLSKVIKEIIVIPGSSSFSSIQEEKC